MNLLHWELWLERDDCTEESQPNCDSVMAISSEKLDLIPAFQAKCHSFFTAIENPYRTLIQLNDSIEKSRESGLRLQWHPLISSNIWLAAGGGANTIYSIIQLIQLSREPTPPAWFLFLIDVHYVTDTHGYFSELSAESAPFVGFGSKRLMEGLTREFDLFGQSKRQLRWISYIKSKMISIWIGRMLPSSFS